MKLLEIVKGLAVELLPCSHCAAGPGQTCFTAKGKERLAHAARYQRLLEIAESLYRLGANESPSKAFAMGKELERQTIVDWLSSRKHAAHPHYYADRISDGVHDE